MSSSSGGEGSIIDQRQVGSGSNSGEMVSTGLGAGAQLPPPPPDDEETQTESEELSESDSSPKTPIPPKSQLTATIASLPPSNQTLTETPHTLPKKQRKKRRKKNVDKNKPKRPLPAYLFFMKQVRMEVAASNPSASFGEIGKIVGHKWAELPPETKEMYEKLAEEDKSRYLREMSNYVSPVSRPSTSLPAIDTRKKRKGDEDDSDDDDDEATTPGRKKRKTRQRRKKDPEEPKKARSAYTFFMQTVRKHVVDESPGINFSDIGRLVGEKWRNLTPTERKPYEAMATADHQRHDEEMDAYRTRKALEAQPHQESEEGPSSAPH